MNFATLKRFIIPLLLCIVVGMLAGVWLRQRDHALLPGPQPAEGESSTNVVRAPKPFPPFYDALREAARLHPELAVDNSPFNRAFRAGYERYSKEQPDYLNDPKWPLNLAREVAATRPK